MPEEHVYPLQQHFESNRFKKHSVVLLRLHFNQNGASPLALKIKKVVEEYLR